jgi:hypothetical protein
MVQGFRDSSDAIVQTRLEQARILFAQFSTNLRDFWEGYWQSPPGC